MADITPELYEQIKEIFNDRYAQAQILGETLGDIQAKINAGEATFRDADLYAIEVGSMMADAMKQVLRLDELPGGQLYRNIAQRTIGEGLKDTYGIMSNICRTIQEEVNSRAGIGLKPVTPKLETDRVDKIVNRASAAKTQAALENNLTDTVPTFARQVVDDTQKANARLHNKAGLEVKVEREYDGVGLHDGTDVCEFCKEREGTWTYDKAMAAGVFQRHEGCGCIITYTSKKGVVTRGTGAYLGGKNGEGRTTQGWKWDKIDNPREYEKQVYISNNMTASGGRILNPDGEYEQKWAASYYEEIRHKSTDCIKISERLDIPLHEIEDIKDYLFFTGRWYNPITEEYERFVPDPAIAQSWQRLAEGKTIMPHDRTLIKHEQYELQLITDNPGMSQDEAHTIATRKYNYQAESKVYYDNLRERKKTK